jgi:hypothetical protein
LAVRRYYKEYKTFKGGVAHALSAHLSRNVAAILERAYCRISPRSESSCAAALEVQGIPPLEDTGKL